MTKTSTARAEIAKAARKSLKHTGQRETVIVTELEEGRFEVRFHATTAAGRDYRARMAAHTIMMEGFGVANRGEFLVVLVKEPAEDTVPASDLRVGDKVRVKADIGKGQKAAITMTVESVVDDLGDYVCLIGRKHLVKYPDDFAGVTSRLVRKSTAVPLLTRTATPKETPAMTDTRAFDADRSIAPADLDDRDLVVQFMKEDGELAYGEPDDARVDALSAEIARRFGPDALENTATKAVRYKMTSDEIVEWAEDWDDIRAWLLGSAPELAEG